MFEQRRTPIIVGLIALLLVGLAVAAGWRVVRGDDSLLRNVSVEAAEISPNADGEGDVTHINYELSRNGRVSITFTNENGDTFTFRNDKARGAGEYRVAFSGVVDGFTLPDEEIQGEVLARLLPDGRYTWIVSATDRQGNSESAQGQLTISNADTQLPEIRAFSLSPKLFTPNRDGIADRTKLSLDLAKDADLRVFLVMPDGQEVPISEDEYENPIGAAGPHYFDYEGGVDEGATPPPDGTYPIVAIAQDEEGQRIRLEDELTIQYGGVPRAKIYPPPTDDTVRWNATAVALCDTLHFTVTVENYGTTPIRTSGPPPETVYDSDWNYNTLGWFTESGVFRVGIGFENEITNYPYRWAVGSLKDLEEIDGQYYLMPGERAVVTGGIRLTNVFGERNPQPVWAGLIHEDVEVSQFNARVDPANIQVDVPDENHLPECEAREIPVRPLTD
jgi:hypothetical protein